jgi:hypothetical protein
MQSLQPKVSESWAQLGFGKFALDLKERGIDIDAVLTEQVFFHPGDLALQYQRLMEKRDSIAQTTFGYIDAFTRGQADHTMKREYDAFTECVVQAETARISATHGTGYDLAREIATSNISGLALNPHYMKVNPEVPIGIRWGTDRPSSQYACTRLMAVYDKSFIAPKYDGLIQVMLEVYNDPTGLNQNGQIFTANVNAIMLLPISEVF